MYHGREESGAGDRAGSAFRAPVPPLQRHGLPSAAACCTEPGLPALHTRAETRRDPLLPRNLRRCLWGRPQRARRFGRLQASPPALSAALTPATFAEPTATVRSQVTYRRLQSKGTSCHSPFKHASAWTCRPPGKPPALVCGSSKRTVCRRTGQTQAPEKFLSAGTNKSHFPFPHA